MAKKNKSKAEVRTVIVEKSDGSLVKATEEVKKVSGLTSVLPIRANLVGNAIEYEFLVSDSLKNCEDQLFSMRVDAELGR